MVPESESEVWVLLHSLAVHHCFRDRAVIPRPTPPDWLADFLWPDWLREGNICVRNRTNADYHLFPPVANSEDMRGTDKDGAIQRGERQAGQDQTCLPLSAFTDDPPDDFPTQVSIYFTWISHDDIALCATLSCEGLLMGADFPTPWSDAKQEPLWWLQRAPHNTKGHCLVSRN